MAKTTSVVLPHADGEGRRCKPVATLFLLFLAACGDEDSVAPSNAPVESQCRNAFPAPVPIAEPEHRPLPATDGLLLYELQARSANACDPLRGTDAQRATCFAKPAPEVRYLATDSRCNDLPSLERIRLGTIDDLLESTSDPTQGITLRYISEQVGANAVWLMPPFPDNNSEQLPDPCDNLGSPYAVTDYFHLDPALSRSCITSATCDPNAIVAPLVSRATAQGLRIFLDVAFNHFGRNYHFFDVEAAAFDPVLSEAERWDFARTFDPALLRPKLLDDASLASGAPETTAAVGALRERCPEWSDDRLTSAVALWRWLTPEERDRFDCAADTLERLAPAFYAGADPSRPSTGAADSYSGPWRDVRFLYHHAGSDLQRAASVRVREYLFRILNFWTAQGISGFRLDHATEEANGLSPEVWRYLIAKTRYYAERRGQQPPIFLAEEFANPDGMASVADLLTEGYLFGATARGGSVDGNAFATLLGRTARFGGRARVLTHLENHDELRLTDGTGLTFETGRARWAAGLSVWSAPMLLVGQEWGERERLQFRKSSILLDRFDADRMADWPAQVATYRELVLHWRSDAGALLRARPMRPLTSSASTNLLVVAKWDGEGDGLLVLHNLAPSTASGQFRLPPEVAGQLGLDSCLRYRLVTLSRDRELLSCRPAADLARNFTLLMPGGETRWLGQFEPCDP